MGHGAGSADNQALVEMMAAPLGRFDVAPVRALAARRSAVALAAQPASSHLYQRDGLTVAVWGQARLADDAAQGDALAQSLAAGWRQDPDALCARLSGAFSLCIL